MFADPARGPFARGAVADLVYVDTPYGLDQRVMAEVAACAAIRGEVVRA